MAQITINIADSDLSRVVTDICGYYNYQSTILDNSGNPIPNPQTPNQFARAMIVQGIKNICAVYESSVASQSAANSANGLGVT